MGDRQLKTVLALLPKLTLAERVMVAARMEMLGGTKRVAIRNKTIAIYDRLSFLIGRGFIPLRVLQKSKFWKNFKFGADTVDEFIDGMPKMTYNERRKVLFILLGCVVEEAKREGNLNIWRISFGMSHVGGVVERAFPGYIEAGLLLSVLLKEKKDAKL